jgi:hypothetical protein
MRLYLLIVSHNYFLETRERHAFHEMVCHDTSLYDRVILQDYGCFMNAVGSHPISIVAIGQFLTASYRTQSPATQFSFIQCFPLWLSLIHLRGATINKKEQG